MNNNNTNNTRLRINKLDNNIQKLGLIFDKDSIRKVARTLDKRNYKPL